jgi:hypothetical protein
MHNAPLVLVALRLFFSAVAAVVAIAIWSKTRDSVWVLIVLGVLSGYAENIYLALELFGITADILPVIGSVPAIAILISCMPSIFFIAAFCLFLLKRKIKPLV